MRSQDFRPVAEIINECQEKGESNWSEPMTVGQISEQIRLLTESAWVEETKNNKNNNQA